MYNHYYSHYCLKNTGSGLYKATVCIKPWSVYFAISSFNYQINTLNTTQGSLKSADLVIPQKSVGQSTLLNYSIIIINQKHQWRTF